MASLYCPMGVHSTVQVSSENEKWPLSKAEYSPKSSVFPCQQLNEQAQVFQGSLPVAVPHRSHFVEAHISGGGGMSLEGRDLPQDPFSGKGWFLDRNSPIFQVISSLKAGHGKEVEKVADVGHSLLITALLIYTPRYLKVCSWVADWHCCSEARKEAEGKSCPPCQ